MVELSLRYNPYRVETELSLISGERQIPFSEDAAIMWIAGMRIQRWLSEDYPRNFFQELADSLGDDEIRIIFSGTDEDMEDLIHAANRYMQAHPHSQISITRKNERSSSHNSDAKLNQLKKFIDSARKSPYHTVIPSRIWEQLNGLTKTARASIRRLDLKNWHNNEDNFFTSNPWHQVCIHFPFECMASREIRDKLRSLSSMLGKNISREWDRERFMLICECDEQALAELPRTQDRVKKILLEYGLYDLKVYLLSRKECELLYSSSTTHASTQLHHAIKATQLYSRYYAAQYQLQIGSEKLLSTLQQEGFVRDKDFFKRIEKIVRNSPRFRGIRDQQVFACYDWVLKFLEDLEHWLDVADG